MLVFAEDEVPGDGESFSDVARLPVDAPPEVGRAMGVHGAESIAISVRIEARSA